MLLVNIYQYILMFLTSVFTYNQYNKYKFARFNYAYAYKVQQDILGLFLCIFFTLLIGLRPMVWVNPFQWADSYWYYRDYLAGEGEPFVFNINAVNLIWDNLYQFWISKSLGINSLFLLGDTLYFGCTYLACRKWFPHDTLPVYLAFLGAFSTYSYSYNGVKAGIAAAIFLLGMAYYDKKWLSITLILISWGFHHSMQLPIAAYVLTLCFKKPKLYFYAWAFCAVMSILHVGVFASIFAGMSDDTGAKYLAGERDENSYVTGFRADFLLYSAMPILIGYKLVIKEKIQISKTYSVLLRTYLCTNGIWLLCMYASYTNRIAYLSWFMYPFVLIYPFLKEDLRGFIFLKTTNQYTMFAKVMVYHLAFTLFMELIYYKLLKG